MLSEQSLNFASRHPQRAVWTNKSANSGSVGLEFCLRQACKDQEALYLDFRGVNLTVVACANYEHSLAVAAGF
jgi:hypothetical protein